MPRFFSLQILPGSSASNQGAKASDSPTPAGQSEPITKPKGKLTSRTRSGAPRVSSDSDIRPLPLWLTPIRRWHPRHHLYLGRIRLDEGGQYFDAVLKDHPEYVKKDQSMRDVADLGAT